MDVPYNRYKLDRAIETLSEAFPKAFFVNPRQRKPLKHDIAQDLKTVIANDPSSDLQSFDMDTAVDW